MPNPTNDALVPAAQRTAAYAHHQAQQAGRRAHRAALGIKEETHGRADCGGDCYRVSGVVSVMPMTIGNS